MSARFCAGSVLGANDGRLIQQHRRSSASTWSCTSADWAKLKENFQTNTFYPADFKWNGQTVFNVGIRSRGRGSRNANKPGLKVDFDRYSANQKFLGLKSLVLDNLTQDPSGIHETVSMRFTSGSAFPRRAKRTSGSTCGASTSALYALVESVDKEFLARIYGVDRRGHAERRLAVRVRRGRTTGASPISAPVSPRSSCASTRPRTNRRSDEEKYRPIQELITLANQTPIEDVSSR